MKDSSVSPVGLLHPSRQRQLLEALASRFADCAQQHARLRQEHQLQARIENSSLDNEKAATTEACRTQRREMLELWDASEEKLTANYELQELKLRRQLASVSQVFRKKLEEGLTAIDRKVEARKQAIEYQYEQRKGAPSEQREKETKEINLSLTPIAEELEWGRALTIRRLNRLPEVPPAATPEENMRELEPKTVRESLDTMYKLSRKCKGTVAEMHSGMASKIVDSFYLPAGVAVFLVLWAVLVLAFGPRPPWLLMVAGIPIALVIAFTIYGILLWPLRKMTRRLYPQAERIGEAANECAATGRQISATICTDSEKELLDRRNAHLANAETWQEKQKKELIESIGQQKQTASKKLTEAIEGGRSTYTSEFARVRAEMHEKAERLAQQISSAIAGADDSVNTARASSKELRRQQLDQLARRLKDGVSKGVNRISSTSDQVQHAYPPWDEVAASQSTKPHLDFIPLGHFSINDRLRESLAKPSSENGTQEDFPNVFSGDDIPKQLPIALHRRVHSGVLIKAHQSQMDEAIKAAHHFLWRLLTGVQPSRAKLTLIDPLGRGQHFTSFMALADHDPTLVGHRVWTTDNKIEERLGELAHHVEDVLQTSLRDRFQRVEDYNEVAGAMAEPYRAVAAIGFPESLSRNGYKHLKALIESGLRCGIFTVMVVDKDRPWPIDMPMPVSDKLMNISVDQSGAWTMEHEGLEELPVQLGQPPMPSISEGLIDRIGKGAVEASKVEIPLASILPDATNGSGSTDDGIEITVGSQGANRTIALSLGEGVCQHVLIAGKTGSGKSTLLHSIISSGAFHYRPDQLEFYLLDFKKGVEFKPYADQCVPHARVIGIESEREFGRSVLQRLDSELQIRGEKFRAAGAQEIGAYRAASGQQMPRIMLVVDEFQELFVRDDRLANDCSMLLDRLVRQGRSFGMHVVLSSQSLAGAYSLPRATLGQMAVRVAMHCSESDAALILSDDNTAARLLSRPGEAIYNDAGGLLEGNQPFQVAWLSSSDHRTMLQEIAKRDDSFNEKLGPPVIFEGNRPCRWTPALADAAIHVDNAAGPKALKGLLGEAVEIGPPLALELNRNAGRNVLMISPSEARAGIVSTLVSSIYKSHRDLGVVYFDGTRVDDGISLTPWFEEAGIPAEVLKVRDSENKIRELAEIVAGRDEEASDPPILVVIDPLERYRDFRQDDSFNFSLDNPGGGTSAALALRDLMKDGPSVNVFTILCCNQPETLARWLPRQSHHDLELRVLGRLNASDSSMLIDSPAAAELTTATMLLYDDSEGRITKFRQCDPPDAGDVKKWLA